MCRVALAFALVPALVLSLLGCQGMGMQSARDKAMSLLSESVKAQVEGYLKDVDDVTALLRGVDSFQSALDTAPKLAPYVSRIEDGYTTLRSYDAETLRNVRTAFSPELVAAADGFSAQLERMADSSTFGRVLKPVLENVRLFE